MQASLPFGKIAGAFDPDLAEHGLQSPFMKPLLHAFRSTADPFVPNRWSDPNQSSSPRGNTCRDTVADPPAFRPTAAPDHSAVSSPPRCVRRLALKSGSPNF